MKMRGSLEEEEEEGEEKNLLYSHEDRTSCSSQEVIFLDQVAELRESSTPSSPSPFHPPPSSSDRIRISSKPWLDNQDLASMGYIDSFEGIRGWAVLMTNVCHFLPYNPFNHNLGAAGVSAFFVLSGFLITGVLIGLQKDNRGSSPSTFPSYRFLLGFYSDRAVRLLPPLYICVGLISAYEWYDGVDSKRILNYASRAIFNYENMNLAILRPMYRNSPFKNTWSLAMEEQFYLVWSIVLPMLIRLKPRSRLLLVSFSMLLSLYVRIQTHVDKGSLWNIHWHHAFLSNVFKMLLGSSLRLFPLPRFLFRPWACYLGFLILFLNLLTATWPFSPRWSDSFGAASSVFLITGSMVKGNPILDLESIRFVGRISYALYLWQLPLMVAFTRSFPSTEQNFKLGFTTTFFAFFVAMISTFWVEEPLRARYKAWRKRRRSRNSASNSNPV
ncbi:hypothetical protein IE53DRAFT_252360 [Violaceomyces palustris]|uniref:Uncharacterized protein n=1 Tax=Violaceomyces palustris TaxID=1673888 RepID=A0ACD0NNI9_9BASI|nr:hypothetical protein IE53DRAFT_252360 [Violaceomyces palustris]